jgi:hypothetical protein
VLRGLHVEIQDYKTDLQNVDLSFNDEDVRSRFSVVYSEFRVSHPKLYGHIDRSKLNHRYYYIFNKFDDKEDSYYLKYIFSPSRYVYG